MYNLPVLYHRIGVKISTERRKVKLRQADLADEVGLSRTSIVNIEQGRQSIQIDTLYAIARTLDVTVDKLLPLSSDPTDYDGWLETYE